MPPSRDRRRLVVLVEGASDAGAVVALCERAGIDFSLEDVSIVAIGGITNIGHHFGSAIGAGDTDIVGLCDAAETIWVERALTAFGHTLAFEIDLTHHGFFVCNADLEEELIRAIGPDAMLRYIESQRELESFRTLQQQPQHRTNTILSQLHRFIGTKSGRKVRYGRGLAELIGDDHIPEPLADLVEAIVSWRDNQR